MASLLQRRAALALLVTCILPVANGFGFSHAVRSNLRAARGSIMSLESDAFLGEAFIERASWLVLFCGHRDTGQCLDLRKDFLGIRLRNDAPMKNFQLAEVNCTRNVRLCSQQGFASSLAAVVHYSEGQRRSVWLSDGEDSKADFARWLRMNFENDSKFAWSLHGACNWIVKMPQRAFDQTLHAYPNLRRSEVALIAIAIVLVQIAVVGWVVVEGFLLWPSALQKTE